MKNFIFTFLIIFSHISVFSQTDWYFETFESSTIPNGWTGNNWTFDGSSAVKPHDAGGSQLKSPMFLVSDMVDKPIKILVRLERDDSSTSICAPSMSVIFVGNHSGAISSYSIRSETESCDTRDLSIGVNAWTIVELDLPATTDDSLYLYFSPSFFTGVFGNVYLGYFKIEGPTMNPTSILNHGNSMTKIYPNPVKDKLFFTGNESVESYSIVNSIGMVVRDKTKINNLSVDVSELISGVYYVLVWKDNEIVKNYKITK